MLYQTFKKIATSKEYTSHTAVIDADTKKQYTYNALLELVEGYSNQLKQQNVVPGAVVALYLPKGVELVAWQIACSAVGVAFLTLQHGEESRMRAALEQVKPQALVRAQGEHIVIEYYEGFTAVDARAGYIVFTSGSTGRPKQILLTLAPLVEVVQAQAKITHCGKANIALWLLNPAFDASLSDIYMPLLSGATLVITNHKPHKIKIIAQIINEYGVSHVDLPPAVFNLWLGYLKRSSLPTLKHIIFGGELAPQDITIELSQHAHLYNAYGPSETTICSSMSKVNKNWQRNDIGKPLPGVLYKAVNGELHIGGTHCALGYAAEPELNRRFYTDQMGQAWFATGDLVEHIDHKFLYKGRKDRQFKHRGQLICPEEIEAAAYTAGAAQAIARYKDNTIELLYNGQIDTTIIQEKLPAYMWPQKYQIYDIGVNQNGKLCA